MREGWRERERVREGEGRDEGGMERGRGVGMREGGERREWWLLYTTEVWLPDHNRFCGWMDIREVPGKQQACVCVCVFGGGEKGEVGKEKGEKETV